MRPLADDILKVSSAALGGPYNALLRSPHMARRALLNHRVPDASWQEAVTAMGEQAVIDLTVLSGTYVMVATCRGET
ncbi:MAG: hypothetical protein ACYC0T_01290 [Ramlibacter sp.]